MHTDRLTTTTIQTRDPSHVVTLILANHAPVTLRVRIEANGNAVITSIVDSGSTVSFMNERDSGASLPLQLEEDRLMASSSTTLSCGNSAYRSSANDGPADTPFN